MATFSYPSYFIRASSNRDSHDQNKQKLNNIRINGASSMSSMKPDTLSQPAGVVSTYNSFTSVNVNSITTEACSQNIPTKKQSVDPHRQGLIIEGGVGYRQTVVIRSYEVGPDKTATLESILNLLQETALNHVWMSGLLSNGFGATHGMVRNNLIWVVSRMQVQVDHYPIWGEVVEIETWVGASIREKWNATRLACQKPSHRPCFCTCHRFIDKQAIKEDCPEKIVTLDNKARYMDSNSKAKRSDLDMNHHVNNVMYTIPDEILESHKLSTIILEYRRECGNSDIVQSLCQPVEGGILEDGLKHKNGISLNGFSLASEILQGSGLLCNFEKLPLRYTHLLQVKGGVEMKRLLEEEPHGRERYPPSLSPHSKSY
ncbi:hypothetical protein ACJW30_08G165400 [Castanea mollissima]